MDPLKNWSHTPFDRTSGNDSEKEDTNQKQFEPQNVGNSQQNRLDAWDSAIKATETQIQAQQMEGGRLIESFGKDS